MKGWQKTTFIDFGNNIASIFFYGGCNLRCPYCHNKDLVYNSPTLPTIPDETAIEYLKNKKHLYEGVCITGGEPTLSPEVESTMKAVKAEGLLVKLDTNGTDFTKLKKWVESGLVDYVALDIKTSLSKYPGLLVGNGNQLLEDVKKSISYLKSQSLIDYEFRSTIFPPLFEKEDLLEVKGLVSGAKKYFIQQFNPGRTLHDVGDVRPYPTSDLNEICDLFKDVVGECVVR
jgi:pyruvate formate lyase activating enzyme